MANGIIEINNSKDFSSNGMEKKTKTTRLNIIRVDRIGYLISKWIS